MFERIEDFVTNIRQHRGWLLAGVVTVVIAIVLGTLVILLRGSP